MNRDVGGATVTQTDVTDDLVIGGRYRIVRELGRGGMGSVFEVEHVGMGRRFALKTIHPDLVRSERTRKRFRREARIGGTHAHHHVVPVVDYGEFDGVPYLVMELLEGRNLRELISEAGPLDFRRAVKLMLGACQGVHSLHQKGIVHRDIKPSNLFVCGTEQDECIKILDFGVAKAEGLDGSSNDASGAGSVVGTLTYMAPEQIRGESLDARTDIYALGLVLYECLTGEPAFQEESRATLMYRILEGAPPRLDQRVKNVPTDLIEVVERAIRPVRADRFASAEELASALESVAVVTSTEERLRVKSAAIRATNAKLVDGPSTEPPRSRFVRWRLQAVLLLIVLLVGASVVGRFALSEASDFPAQPTDGSETIAASPLSEPFIVEPDPAPVTSGTNAREDAVETGRAEVAEDTKPAAEKSSSVRSTSDVSKSRVGNDPKVSGTKRTVKSVPPASAPPRPTSGTGTRESPSKSSFDRKNPYLE